MPVLSALVRYGYAPFMMLGLTGAAYWVVSELVVVRGPEAELELLADYASTPAATNTNIGMYRRGLVRNALAVLSLVPLTHRLLHASGLDIETTAENFAQATGYVDDGPNFWRLAGRFIAYVTGLPEFAARWQQDVLALDAAMVELARRLGESAPVLWPETAAGTFLETGRREPARYVASRAAVMISTNCDLTAWLENAEDFDPNGEFEPSTRHWLIYFPAAEADPEYAELSERASTAFKTLSSPKTTSEVSLALVNIADTEVLEVIHSLADLGVIVSEEDD